MTITKNEVKKLVEQIMWSFQTNKGWNLYLDSCDLSAATVLDSATDLEIVLTDTEYYHKMMDWAIDGMNAMRWANITFHIWADNVFDEFERATVSSISFKVPNGNAGYDIVKGEVTTAWDVAEMNNYAFRLARVIYNLCIEYKKLLKEKGW